MHYLTRKPSQEADGYVNLQFGEDGRTHVEGALGGGLTDSVSGRLSAVYAKDDGLIENDIGPEHDAAGRILDSRPVLIEPSDDLEVLLKAQYAKEDAARGGYAHQVAFDGDYPDDPNATDFFGYRDADGDPFTVSQDFNGYTKSEVTDLMARVDWTLGDFTLTSITNFQDITDGYGEDADVTPFDIYNYEQGERRHAVLAGAAPRLGHRPDANVVGLYYLNIDGQYNTRQTGDAFFGTGVGYPAGTAEVVNAKQKTETWAIFGQTEITLADQWSLILGGRYNSDSKDYDYRSTDIYFLQGGRLLVQGLDVRERLLRQDPGQLPSE